MSHELLISKNASNARLKPTCPGTHVGSTSDVTMFQASCYHTKQKHIPESLASQNAGDNCYDQYFHKGVNKRKTLKIATSK